MTNTGVLATHDITVETTHDITVAPPVKGRPLNDLGWLAKHQFITAVEAGLLAAQKAEAAIKAGAPSPEGPQIVDVRDNDTFVMILSTAVETCGLDQNALVDLFENSHTTISRWINGKNLPRPQYRDGLVRKLCNKVRIMRDQQMNGNVILIPDQA
jgi:hypothetical protein